MATQVAKGPPAEGKNCRVELRWVLSLVFMSGMEACFCPAWGSLGIPWGMFQHQVDKAIGSPALERREGRCGWSGVTWQTDLILDVWLVKTTMGIHTQPGLATGNTCIKPSGESGLHSAPGQWFSHGWEGPPLSCTLGLTAFVWAALLTSRHNGGLVHWVCPLSEVGHERMPSFVVCSEPAHKHVRR